MRKITGILFFVLFVFLHYGKLLSFVYCLIRVNIAATNSISCDCDEIMATDHEKLPFSHPGSSISFKDKLDQPFIPDQRPVSWLIPGNSTSYFADDVTHVSPGFTNPPQHPPDFMS